jgi:hypothetical protein
LCYVQSSESLRECFKHSAHSMFVTQEAFRVCKNVNYPG